MSRRKSVFLAWSEIVASVSKAIEIEYVGYNDGSLRVCVSACAEVRWSWLKEENGFGLFVGSVDGSQLEILHNRWPASSAELRNVPL